MRDLFIKIIVSVCLLFVFLFKAEHLAANNFIKINLPHGVSFELPKNWVVFSGHERITLNSAVESVLDLSGIEYLSTNISFAANLYGSSDNTIGILNLQYYPLIELTQVDAINASNQDLIELDQVIKENIVVSLQAAGAQLLSWNGTKSSTVNGVNSFVSEYIRGSINGSDTFRVRLIRVFNEGKSFTLTISYNESVEVALIPITDRIIKTLQVEGLPKSQVGNELYNLTEVGADGSNWFLLLLISIMITWSIGLIPPITIRFIFKKAPIKKNSAIGIVIFFWFTNLIIFSALGSEGNVHIALTLIAFVSYSILRFGNKKIN
jgi:hypothetical protein